MMPSIRRITSVLRALVLGALVLSCTLTGCSDPNDPATHVEKLNDPIYRGQAIDRLRKFYLDAMATSENKRDAEKVKEVRDKIIEPLAKLIIDGTLDNQLSDKEKVVYLLADSRDDRALPALIKVLNDYKPDDRRPEDYDTRVGEVVLHITEMIKSGQIKDNKELNAAMFGLFKRVQAWTMKATNGGFGGMLRNALLALSDPAWESELITMLEVPVKSVQKKGAKAAMEQRFWQAVAADILGKLKSKKAVRSLVKCVLSPLKGKAKIAAHAAVALVKIGQPSLDAALKLMNGEDDELEKYAANELLRQVKDAGEEPKEEKGKKLLQKEADFAYLNNAVLLVGNMGTKAAIAPMLKVLNDEEAPKETKAVIAAQVGRLPKNADLTAAFKKEYAGAKVDDKLPTGAFSKEALLENGLYFFDKDVNQFMFEDAIALEGKKKEDVIGVQAGVLSAAIRAATPDQWTYVEKLKAKVLQEIKSAKGKDKFFIKNAKKKNEKEGPYTDKKIVEMILNLELRAGTCAPAPKDEKDKKKLAWETLSNFGPFSEALGQAEYINALKWGKKVLEECKENTDCYFKKLSDPEASKTESRMIGLKAAYMVGLLGGEPIKTKIMEMWPRITKGDMRNNLAKILVRHSPVGDDATVGSLQKWIDAAHKSKDPQKIGMVTPYELTIVVLKARK